MSETVVCESGADRRQVNDRFRIRRRQAPRLGFDNGFAKAPFDNGFAKAPFDKTTSVSGEHRAATVVTLELGG